MSRPKVTEAATIAELRARARARLPRAVFDFIDGAADDELTLRWNVADFDTLEWRPRVLNDVSKRDSSAMILGARSRLAQATRRPVPRRAMPDRSGRQ